MIAADEIRARRAVKTAERWVLTRARAWYVAAVGTAAKHPTTPGLAAAYAEKERRHGLLILALGLDEEARGDLRRAQRRRRS